ncbi:hypothetical protein ACFQ6C_26325 [Streptomyces sp. NPDC056454]|uniref:hypothetical protein n=1 Tax=Streptomyces sp. NPDC056454 TaxID=3345823 RepID=UPI0036757891
MTANATPPVINFRRGGTAAEEAEKEANPSYGRREAKFFGLKNDGDQTVVRLITDHDDWIYVLQHSFMPTKPAPQKKEEGDYWPPSMMAVCRKDEVFAGHYTDDYLCDNKIKNTFGKVGNPQVRLWALAIEREVVRGDGTDALGGPAHKDLIVGVRDKIDEIDELDSEGKSTGVKLRYPRVLVINMPMKGFFSNLKALYGLHKTVCDRDYEITRDGSGKDTNYRMVQIDPVADVAPGTPHWGQYQTAIAERGINLDAMVAERATDAYYAKWFDPTKEVDKDGNVVPAGTGSAVGAVSLINLDAQGTPAAATPAADISPDLRSRIANLGVPAAPPAS